MRFSEFVSQTVRESERGVEAILDAAPTIILVLVNALVAFGDWRIFTALRQATGDALAAAAVVAVSAAGFIVWWDLAARYRFANTLQRTIAVIMTAASLALAGYGWWVASAIEAGLGAVDLGRFYGLVTALTVGHVLAGMAWVWADDRIRLARQTARARARSQHQVRSVQMARALLAEVRQAFDEYRGLVDAYGEDAVRDMLAALVGKDEPEHPAIPVPAMTPRRPASTSASQPAPEIERAGVTTSNNDHHPDEPLPPA